jgi:hypothetical protein
LAVLVVSLILLEAFNSWFYAIGVGSEPPEIYFVDEPARAQKVWDSVKKYPKMLELEAYGNLSVAILIHIYSTGGPGFCAEWWVVATTLQPDEHGFVHELVLRTTYPYPSLRKTHTSSVNYTLVSPDSGARVIEEFIDQDPDQYWVGFTNESLRVIGPFLMYRRAPMDFGITIILNLKTGNLMVAATGVWMGHGGLLLPEGEDLVFSNIRDVAMVARKFGTKLGDSNWDSEADLNNDGIVNIVDISMIARCFR